MALLQLDTGKEAKLKNSGKHGPLKRERIRRSCESFNALTTAFMWGGHLETSSYISTSVVIVQWFVVVYLIYHGRQKIYKYSTMGSKGNV